MNIAVSSYFAKALNKQFDLPFIVVANMVKIRESKPTEKRLVKYDVIHVGTFNENKNQMLLLESLFNYRFGRILLVGEGPNEKQLKDFVVHNQLSDLVTFLPFQPRNELLMLMEQSACLAITSHHETFGVVAIEALSCGIPVIATKSGGPEDIVIEGESGYLIESTPWAFYTAFCKISEDLSKFRPEKLIAFANEHFSEKAIASKLSALYLSIISKTNG